MSKIEIKVDGTRTKIFVDGLELQGVRGYELTQSVETIPILKLDMIATDLYVVGEDISCLSDDWRKRKSNDVDLKIDGKQFAKIIMPNTQ